VERATDTTVLIIENHRIKGAVKVIKAVKMPHACRDRGRERGGREGERGRGRNLSLSALYILAFFGTP
jgi:hypothetical protein